MRHFRRSQLWNYLSALGLVLAVPTRGYAQNAVHRTQPSDTGRMAPMPDDYRGYDTPGLCVAAAKRARAQWDRRFVRDTAVYLMDARRETMDTLPAVVVTLAQRCGRRFTVAKVPPAELYNLLRLALLANDDAKAEAALARQLAIASSDTARAGILWDAYNVYEAAAPRRSALSAKAAARLSALGPAARDLRMAQVLREGNNATLGTERLRRNIASIDSLSRLFPETDTMYVGAVNTAIQAGPSILASMALYDGMQTGAIRNGVRVGNVVDSVIAVTAPAWLARYKSPEMRLAVANQIEAWKLTVRAANVGWGAVVPPFRANYWYGDSLVPGKVTVVVFLERGVGVNDQQGSFRQADWLKLAQLRELARRFPRDSVQLALIVPTRGYVWNSGVITPKQEADVTGWYFRERLGLPVTVAVVETKFSSNPTDGHRENQDVDWQRQYGEQSVLPRIIAKDGTDQTFWESMYNEYIFASVARELARRSERVYVP